MCDNGKSLLAFSLHGEPDIEHSQLSYSTKFAVSMAILFSDTERYWVMISDCSSGERVSASREKKL